MKIKAIIMGAALFMSPSLFAETKSQEIDKCVKKNNSAVAQQTAGVVKAWCACIYDEMPDNAAGDLDSWAKKHKSADNKCGKKAGWKD